MRILVVSLLVAVPVMAQHEAPEMPSEPRTYTLATVSDAEAQAWREDLSALVHGLELTHPDPYHHTSEADFARAVESLDATIPRLAAHEIIVEFARLLALVGDGHTSLPLYAARGVGFHVLPYRLGLYEAGLYVEAADQRHAALVGGKVMTIGGVPAHEAVARVTPLISRDNDNWIAAIAPFLLNRIEVLHALGLAADLSGVELTVEVKGQTRGARITPLPTPPAERHGLPFLPEYTDRWVDARDEAETPPPLYQQAFDEVYGWTYMPEHDLLYIKWNQVQNRETGPTALEVFREAMAFAREHRPARTVVDIRNNTGGEGGLVPPVVREIVRTREVDEPGSLFVVIGRRTFSAGQMMTEMLERLSTAVLVGEPSSAFYNGYAGHGPPIPLPHSGISFASANAYYQMGASPHDTRRQATPQLAALPTFADYRANRDPALGVIVTYEPDAFAQDVLAALAASDEERAEDIIQRHDASPINRFAPARTQLNALGYRLLRESKGNQAIHVFELNVRVHPEYANGWDSLGEAYVRAHRRDEAIAAFRRALTIQPDLAPSREWLQHLKAEEF